MAGWFNSRKKRTDLPPTFMCERMVSGVLWKFERRVGHQTDQPKKIVLCTQLASRLEFKEETTRKEKSPEMNKALGNCKGNTVSLRPKTVLELKRLHNGSCECKGARKLSSFLVFWFHLFLFFFLNQERAKLDRLRLRNNNLQSFQLLQDKQQTQIQTKLSGSNKFQAMQDS
jgi:hypothetical protein